jgi:hypothetical protein
VHQFGQLAGIIGLDQVMDVIRHQAHSIQAK